MAKRPKEIRLGDGVSLTPTQHALSCPTQAQGADESVSGYILQHPKHDGTPDFCEGHVPTCVHCAYGRDVWNVVSVKPITLTPSCLCHCGFHGFVRDGKWVAG